MIEKRLGEIDLNFYALRKDGEYCGRSLWETRPAGARSRNSRFVPRMAGAGTKILSLYWSESDAEKFHAAEHIDSCGHGSDSITMKQTRVFASHRM